MQSENNKTKTICNENIIAAVVPIPARVTAELTGTSESYVKKIRISNRPDNSAKAQEVKLVDELLKDGVEVLVSEVKKVTGK